MSRRRWNSARIAKGATARPRTRRAPMPTTWASTGAAVSSLTGLVRDHERVEHQVAQRSGVEQKIDWPGHVTIRAQDLFDFTAVSAQEEFNLHRVGGDDGVVIRFEGRLHDGRHSLEADGVGSG